MKRPTASKKGAPAKKSKQPKRQANRCRAIILIDAGPFFRQARAKYLHSKKQLDALASLLRQLHEVDEPASQKSFILQHGALVTQARTLHQELVTLKNLIADVEEFATYRQISRPAAYKRLMLIRAGTPAPEDVDPPDFLPEMDTDVQDDAWEFDEDEELGELRAMFADIPHGMEDSYRNLYEMMAEAHEASTGVRPPDFDTLLGAAKAKENNVSASSSREIKECYRAIVRILHPDSAEKFSERESNLWHQAQEAYAQRDLGALQLILARCEGGDGAELNLDKIESLGLLLDMVSQAQVKLRMLQYEVQTAEKYSPHWKFTELSQKKQKSRMETARREIVQAITMTEYELPQLRKLVDRWANPKPKAKNPSKKPTKKPVKGRVWTFPR